MALMAKARVVVLSAAAVLGMAACGSSNPPGAAGPRLLTHSCRAPSHFYSIAEIRSAFAAHGVPLPLISTAGPKEGGAMARALRAGVFHGLLTENRAVLVTVLSRRAPPAIYKASENCQGDRFTQTYVLGNVGVSVPDSDPRQARQAKAALLDLEASS